MRQTEIFHFINEQYKALQDARGRVSLLITIHMFCETVSRIKSWDVSSLQKVGIGTYFLNVDRDFNTQHRLLLVAYVESTITDVQSYSQNLLSRYASNATKLRKILNARLNWLKQVAVWIRNKKSYYVNWTQKVMRWK